MSSKELRRVEVLSRVKSDELKLVDAAELMQVSYRQTKRLWARFQQEGAAGLKHGNAGRRSNRAKPEALRRKALKLVRTKYGGAEGARFGPTLAAEHLASEDGVEVDAETLRRWMLDEGLWTLQRRRKAHRQRRERKAHFGELVQVDGSFHYWYEDRGPRSCLMNMVDDATGETLCRMGEQETIWAAVGVLEAWIEKYGVPCALYTDWKNVYVREPNEEERQSGKQALTQFGRMCAKLGIRIIAAGSPQAKGRVERNHGTHQDRLVKKLRRLKIGNDADANRYLEGEYLPEHNRRFTCEPASAEDYHRKAPGRRERRRIFCLETERQIGNDWVVRYQGRYLQLLPQSRRYGPTRAKALVCEWADGSLEVYYRDEKMKFEELPGPRPRPTPETLAESCKVEKSTRKWKPAANHPWRGRATGAAAPPLEARPSASP
jgi:transposase